MAEMEFPLALDVILSALLRQHILHRLPNLAISLLSIDLFHPRARQWSSAHNSFSILWPLSCREPTWVGQAWPEGQGQGYEGIVGPLHSNLQF